jgi:ATP-dependent RNA helicase RhlB
MVIDEADRMFDLGFIKDVRYIFRRLPPRDERQVLLFSATLSHRVLELAYEHMNEAEKLVVETDNVTADKVRQVVYFPAKEEKMPLLLNLIEQHKPERSIVFANTKAAVERIKDRLRRHGYNVGALSGDVPQVKRQKLLQRFKDSQIDMLVATDVAARGLHIPHVSHVFNYDLPQDAEDYVHRIGRTARLGAEGDAISFACDLYAMGLPDIEAFIEQKIPVESIDPAMLKAPAPRSRPANDASSDDADVDAPPSSGASAPRKRRRRSRSGGGGGAGKSASSGNGQAASPSPAQAEAGNTGGQASDAASQAEPPAAGEHPRKRRRRRGGRNRGKGGSSAQGRQGSDNGNNRNGNNGDGNKQSGNAHDASAGRRNAGGRGGMEPAREARKQASANGGRGGSRQVHAEPAPAAKPKKAGFFRRLFGGD